MLKTERNAVIDACIQRVLSLRTGRLLEECEIVELMTGAACFRLVQFKAEPLTEPPCRWTEDEDGNWHTDCGDMFVFTTHGPIENGLKFCGYCGQPLTSEPLAAQPMETEP